MWRNAFNRGLGPLCLLALVLGCARKSPPPAAGGDDWYRKDRLFDAFDAGARDVSLVNAYLLELACFAGDRGTFELDKTLTAWGFDRRRDFRDIQASTYGFVASNAEVVLVTFGGTDFLNARDLLSDVDALQLVSDDRYCAAPGAMVHRGFRDSLNPVIDGVIEEVRRQSAAAAAPSTATSQPNARAATPRPKRLWVAGHSRGGAFAVLAAAALAKARAGGAAGLPELAGLYTFGQPRAGNGAFVESLTAMRVPLVRFVNHDDPIPNVPPAGLNGRLGYQHGGTVVYLGADGRVVKSAPEGLPDVRSVASDVANHYQPAYQRALFSALSNPNMVEEPAWRANISPQRVGALPRPAQ